MIDKYTHMTPLMYYWFPDYNWILGSKKFGHLFIFFPLYVVGDAVRQDRDLLWCAV